MANAHGLLPKVDREELDDELKARLDVWFEHAYQDDNLFLTMAKRPELFKAIFGFIAYVYGGKSKIDRGLFELCRLRMARNNECVH
ncbi:MAG: hypothetical protein JRL30_22575 [Deltaproteobacteria bacterium]|nr:hypothetical protein [Deltaproteobacteria bacterium]